MIGSSVWARAWAGARAVGAKWVDDETIDRGISLVRRGKTAGEKLAAPQSARLVRGKLRGTDRELSILALGPPGFSQDVAQLCVSQVDADETAGPLGRIPTAPPRGGGHDLVARVQWPWMTPASDEIAVALSVDARLPANEAPETYAANHMSSSLRRAWRDRDALGVEITSTSSLVDLREWYVRLHEPLIRSRHGATAYVVPLAELEGRLSRIEIVLARRNGEPVAGELLEHDRGGRVLTVTAIGALPSVVDDSKLYKNLTVALDYRALERAHERGFPMLSFGYTVPRVDSGLLAYKRQWGSAFVPDDKVLRALIHVRPRGKCQWFERCPVITQERGAAVVRLGVTRVDEVGLGALRERIKMSDFRNTARIVVHTPPDLAERVAATTSQMVGVPRVDVEPVDEAAGDRAA